MNLLRDRVSGVLEMGYRQITADRILDWTIRNRLFDLGDLAPPARAASWFGYTSLLVLLAAMLGLEFAGVRLPASSPAALGETAGRVPVEVVVIAGAGFVAAWSLILTGVLYARRSVAILFLVVFAVQVIVLGARTVLASLLLVALAICLQVLFRSKASLREWSRIPIFSILMWVMLLSALMVQSWIGAPSADKFASLLTSVMSMSSVLAIGLWTAMGCGAIVTAVRLSIAVIDYLRRHVSPTALKFIAIVMVLVICPGAMIFGIVERDPAWIIGGSASVLFIPILVTLVLRRQWTNRRAAVMTGLCITVLVFTFGLSLAMSDSTRIGRGVQSTGIFPPVLLFFALAADHLLRFGKPIKTIAPRLGSQVAWVLIYLGVVILVLTALIFLMNHPSSVTGRVSQAWPKTLATLTFAAMLVSGPIYLTWVLSRRREWWASAGEPPTHPPFR